MFNYHIIPTKTKTPWLMDHRVFYFQLGKRPKYEAFVKKNYEEINRIANQNGLSFIFHRHFTENNIDHSQIDHEFFKEISKIDEKKFYDELEWQIFTYQAIDPVYIVRKYNDTSLIAWGYDAFKKGKRGLKFPYEALLPLDEITLGEYCQLDPCSDQNWNLNTEYMALRLDKTKLLLNKETSQP